jgi:ribonuclease PH
MRPSNRANDQLRPVTLERGFARHAEGSCLVSFGNTKVLCAASVEDRVPGWMRGKGSGWVTAEYAMLPRSTHERMQREVTKGKQSGRTLEIQRLIARSLRAVVDLKALGERDDHGRLRRHPGRWRHAHGLDHRCLGGALRCAQMDGEPLHAVRAGPEGQGRGDFLRHLRGEPVLDLDYLEDSAAETDANFVLTGSGGMVEIQGTAEGAPFSEDELAR